MACRTNRLCTRAAAVAVTLLASLLAVQPTASAAVRPGEDVFEFGSAVFAGSTKGVRLAAPLVGIASTSTGRGYWQLARDGGIFSFGDAAFHGSTGAIRLNQPVVSMAADPRGGGYWTVAADGGVFAFDAPFLGSAGNIPLVQPVVGMAPTRSGDGYWLVARDGGIFSYGDATFSGSTGAIRLNQPIVGMAADPDGLGYWFVAADGGVFSFDADFGGSAVGRLEPGDRVVGMAANNGGPGYWLATASGAVIPFGGAPDLGGARGAGRGIIGMASTPTSSGYWVTASQALTRDTRLTTRGIGPVVAGMTLREAEQVAGVDLSVESFEDFGGYCYYAGVEGLDLYFLVVSPGDAPVRDPGDGVVGSVNIFEGSQLLLENGLGVGATEAQVYQAYPGRVVTEPHTYDDRGHYLTIRDGDFGVRFETDGSRVDAIHVGDYFAIQAVEGCA